MGDFISNFLKSKAAYDQLVCGPFTIKKVIYNDPATIVLWKDGTKTVVKRQPEDPYYDAEKGLAMAIAKKALGNKGNYYNVFKEYQSKEYITSDDNA